ncbi:MAG: serine/threonine protein kinase [Oscillatoria sp. PMC 1068.18]|nr:serine/threonine protein kinase [Oscillatoria sp. PMC 1076.18]MEC4991834.1 serine/threonine protein kinase [Oscillatoria sp. PMC 1068.18]
MSCFYQVYGLNLLANFPIFGLKKHSEVNSPDVSIYLAQNSQSFPLFLALNWQPVDCRFPLSIATDKEETYFRLRYAYEPDYAEFIINSLGSKIWIDCSQNVTFKDIAALLLHPVLGCVLRLRGVTCLHSNVIIVDNRAIAIVGQKGAGKSTTAAALVQKGKQLLADDIAALVERENTFYVQPGYPSLRLHSETALKLYGNTDGFESVFSQPERWFLTKKNVPLQSADEFIKYPLSLAAIYLLGKREPHLEKITLKTINSAMTILKLLPHLYVNWFPNKASKANDFKVLSRLVDRVPVKQVHRPNDLTKLPEICQIILDDVQQIS